MATPSSTEARAVQAKLKAAAADLLAGLQAIRPVSAPEALADGLGTLGAAATDSLSTEGARHVLQFAQDMRSVGRIFRDDVHTRRVTFVGGSRPTPAEYDLVGQTARAFNDVGFGVIHGDGPGTDDAVAKATAHSRGAYALSIERPGGSPEMVIEGHDRRAVLNTPEARKNAMVNHSHAIIVAPGGIGTFDKLYGALTVMQTGKVPYRPIVLIAPEGSEFWEREVANLRANFTTAGVISPADPDLMHIRHSPEEALQLVTGFYRNFHSLDVRRQEVGQKIKTDVTIRLNARPTVEEMRFLNSELATFVDDSSLRLRGKPTPEGLHVLRAVVNARQLGKVSAVVDTLNGLGSVDQLLAERGIANDPMQLARLASDPNAFSPPLVIAEQLERSRSLDSDTMALVHAAAWKYVDSVRRAVGPVHDPVLFAENVAELVATACEGATADELDNAALLTRELALNDAVHSQLNGRRSTTVFGSARTKEDDPAFVQTQALGKQLAEAGFVVITGGGPGQMLAAESGALQSPDNGDVRFIGVSIQLPFEEHSNSTVSWQDFATRKLGLRPENGSFVATKGGFGTLDELYEVMKDSNHRHPHPVVMLDTPGSTFWSDQVRVWQENMIDEGRADPRELARFKVFNSPEAVVAELAGHWRNFRKTEIVRRPGGDQLVLHVNAPVTKDDLVRLRNTFPGLPASGTFTHLGPAAGRNGTRGWQGDRIAVVPRPGQLPLDLPALLETINDLGSIHALHERMGATTPAQKLALASRVHSYRDLTPEVLGLTPGRSLYPTSPTGLPTTSGEVVASLRNATLQTQVLKGLGGIAD